MYNNEGRVAGVAPVAHEKHATNATNFIEERVTRVRTANECVEAAKGMPEMQPLFGTLWQTGEIALLAGDTGIGKSILGVNIAASIANGASLSEELCTAPAQKVLYYDFELSDKQFAKRFPNGFHENFLRGDTNPDCYENISFEDIANDVDKYEVSVVIVDNITALGLKSTADGDVAIDIMRNLTILKREKNLSILVLAHIPKVPCGIPLDINHVGGSKHMTNFADSVFFLAKSRVAGNVRYLKQVKSRNAEEMDGVMVCSIEDDSGQLAYAFSGLASESDHLLQSSMTKSKTAENIEAVKKLRSEGQTMEAIAQKMGVNKSNISRWLK